MLLVLLGLTQVPTHLHSTGYRVISPPGHLPPLLQAGAVDHLPQSVWRDLQDLAKVEALKPHFTTTKFRNLEAIIGNTQPFLPT